MSNARSPREVCSTTMGTSGLTVLGFFRVAAGIPSAGRPVSRRHPNGRKSSDDHRPEEGGLKGVGALLLGGLGGLRGLHEQVDRQALGDVLLERVEAPG